MIFRVKFSMGKHLIINETAYPDDIFRIKVSPIFKTANQEKEDIFSHGWHFDPVNITSLAYEKTSHILKNINKNKPKNLDKGIHTILKIWQLLSYTSIIIFNPYLLKLRFIRCWHSELPIKFWNSSINNADLIPDDIIVHVLI